MSNTNKEDDTYVDVVGVDESDATHMHKCTVIMSNTNKHLKLITCHKCDTFIQDIKAINTIDSNNLQLNFCSLTCTKGYSNIKIINCIICNKIVKNNSIKRYTISCEQCCMPVHDKCLDLSINSIKTMPKHGNAWRCFTCRDSMPLPSIDDNELVTCNNFIDVAGVHDDIIKIPREKSFHDSIVNIDNNKDHPNLPQARFDDTSAVNVANVDEAEADTYVDVVGIDESDATHMHKCTVKTRTKKHNAQLKEVNRQLCEHCGKQIFTHNPIIACPTCPLVIHSHCAADADFKIGSGWDGHTKWFCTHCFSKHGQKRYNPFAECIDDNIADHNDAEPLDSMEYLTEISNILNNCTAYSIYDLNKTVNSTNENKFSTFFLNIDGNATNFDHLVTELQLYNHDFSVISLAETNIDQCHQDMYQLDDYKSVYQSKIINKNKGSGIGMYIHNSYNFTEIPQTSCCTPHIESLFVTLTNTKTPITIGVIYRPPSGDIKIFTEEFERIIEQLPSKNVYINGDFNINLHKIDNSCVQFENTFISHGYAPLISLATHERPQCEKNLYRQCVL